MLFRSLPEIPADADIPDILPEPREPAEASILAAPQDRPESLQELIHGEKDLLHIDPLPETPPAPQDCGSERVSDEPLLQDAAPLESLPNSKVEDEFEARTAAVVISSEMMPAQELARPRPELDEEHLPELPSPLMDTITAGEDLRNAPVHDAALPGYRRYLDDAITHDLAKVEAYTQRREDQIGRASCRERV